jgi:hypothetical protein
MYLLPANSGDEHAGYPSASEYERLLNCRVSYLLSRKAHALGLVVLVRVRQQRKKQNDREQLFDFMDL